MSFDDFAVMVQAYLDNPKMRVPKAMTAPFLESPETEEERRIAEVLRARMAADEIALLHELARQTERLEKAQQALAARATKKAAEDVRIATNSATKPGEKDLLSFAIITDEPPPEIAEARHNRCPVPIKPENIDAWLNPDPRDLDAVDTTLEDKLRPYFVHRAAISAKRSVGAPCPLHA